MRLAFCTWIWILAAAASEPVPWTELALSIEEDRGVSSDGATICRVRVVNHGRGTWQGSDIRFEARAIRDGRVAARAPGRFGLTLGPHETLETVIGFLGRFDRLEVVAGGGTGSARGGKSRGRRSGSSGSSAKKKRSPAAGGSGNRKRG
jgi:hypothetical protein